MTIYFSKTRILYLPQVMSKSKKPSSKTKSVAPADQIQEEIAKHLPNNKYKSLLLTCWRLLNSIKKILK